MSARGERDVQSREWQDFDISGFQRDLLDWFARNQRDLPWRKDKDPYKIWVSEIMLQQTRVETVIPYFNRFIEKFPTLEALAAADTDEVLKAWEGLGYYSRARNLHAAVREVIEKYGGVVPDSREGISRLKGIGSYTAGAILSIAYGKREPAVDGNVMRVLARILRCEDDVRQQATRKRFKRIARELIPEGEASSFNQALMELGALICTPRAPQCLFCPVLRYCRGREAGVHEELPVKGKKKPLRAVEMVAAVVRNDDRILINKRPEEGLLAGLWELPNRERVRELSREETIARYLFERFGIRAQPRAHLMEVRHTFSHLQWHLHVYECEWRADGGRLSELADTARWVRLSELTRYAFPVSHGKIVQKLTQE
ncbi:A/G-specific adenine glycosylase [Bacillaceae bacterium]